MNGRTSSRRAGETQELLRALEAAYRAFRCIAEVTHYEGGLPVTFLESREIEGIYLDAVAGLYAVQAAIGRLRSSVI